MSGILGILALIFVVMFAVICVPALETVLYIMVAVLGFLVCCGISLFLRFENKEKKRIKAAEDERRAKLEKEAALRLEAEQAAARQKEEIIASREQGEKEQNAAREKIQREKEQQARKKREELARAEKIALESYLDGDTETAECWMHFLNEKEKTQ